MRLPHPGLDASPIAIKFWEIRNQLEINLEAMERVVPVDKLTMELFGHPLQAYQSHVFDRLAELEQMLAEKEIR